jgi:hypothetical protein
MIAAGGHCPPKAKVTRSNRVGCAKYARARDDDLEQPFARSCVSMRVVTS